MAETFYFKIFLLLVFLLPVSGSDPEVSCVFSQSCMLPCQIQLGSDPLIHWYQVSAGDLLVHSYFKDQDQLGHQNQNFRNRTSLFQDQISRRNASLLLKDVKIQDEGRYKCYTSSSTGYKESFINLRAEAPVSTISISQDGNRITCSSEGIYPPPELTWSTEPPSNTTLNETTRIHQTEDQLYNISSSLTVPDGPDLVYSCSIRTRSSSMKKEFVQKEKEEEEDLPWELIGGSIAAAVVAAGIIIGVVIGCLCKRNQDQEETEETEKSFKLRGTERVPLKSNPEGSDSSKDE